MKLMQLDNIILEAEGKVLVEVYFILDPSSSQGIRKFSNAIVYCNGRAYEVSGIGKYKIAGMDRIKDARKTNGAISISTVGDKDKITSALMTSHSPAEYVSSVTGINNASSLDDIYRKLIRKDIGEHASMTESISDNEASYDIRDSGDAGLAAYSKKN